MTTLPSTELWTRRYHPVPEPSARLVCFPHAGGSASFYFPVSVALHGVAEVIAVQYPGRQDRHAERPIDNIADLADQVYEALIPSADRPLTFFGHSMGAVVAFEVARRFERDGRPVVRVFVSGRRAPSSYRAESVHLRDDDGIIAEMRKLGGTDARLLGDDDVLRMVLPALRGDYKAIETYRADRNAVIASPITALTGDVDPRTTVEEARNWKRHTSGAFDLRIFQGGHFYLLDRAGEVNGILRKHLTS